MPRPFAVIGFTVFLTIAILYDYDTGAVTAVLFLFIAALVISLLIRKTRQARVFPAAFASGALACVLLLAAINFSYLPATAYSGRNCKLVAQLTEYPSYRYGSYYYNAKATEINGEKVSLNLRLVFSSPTEAQPFDFVEGNFIFYTLGSSSEEYMSANKAGSYFMGAYPVNGEYNDIIIPDDEKPFQRKIVDFRKALKNRVYKMHPDESGALAIALMIGDTSGMSENVLDAFKKIGITHIICVSGMHLSLWAMLIMSFLKALHLGDRISSIIAAFGVFAFMLVAGFSYSVIRSGIMMMLYLFANVILKRRDSLNSLGFSLVVLAVINPFSMGSVSLQLSALSTLGIILFSQSIMPEFKRMLDKTDNEYISRVGEKLFSSLSISIVAAAFTMPVSISLYGGYNLISIVANLIAVPISTVCMILYACGTVFGVVIPNNLNFIGQIGGKAGEFLIEFADVVSEIGFLTFKIDSDKQTVIICGVLALCIATVALTYAGRNLRNPACALCAVLFVFPVFFSAVSENEETRINVIDVGNGTAVLVSADNENILIGSGGTEFLGANYISDAVYRTNRSVDTVIIPDSDEYSDSYLRSILFEYRPEKLYCGILNDEIKMLLSETEVLDNSGLYRNENINLESATVDGCYSVYLENDDLSALICFESAFDFSLLPEKFRNADVIILRSDYPDNFRCISCKLVVINSENSRGILLQNEMKKHGINCVATADCGNVIIRGENGYISASRE